MTLGSINKGLKFVDSPIQYPISNKGGLCMYRSCKRKNSKRINPKTGGRKYIEFKQGNFLKLIIN